MNFLNRIKNIFKKKEKNNFYTYKLEKTKSFTLDVFFDLLDRQDKLGCFIAKILHHTISDYSNSGIVGTCNSQCGWSRNRSLDNGREQRKHCFYKLFSNIAKYEYPKEDYIDYDELFDYKKIIKETLEEK